MSAQVVLQVVASGGEGGQRQQVVDWAQQKHRERLAKDSLQTARAYLVAVQRLQKAQAGKVSTSGGRKAQSVRTHQRAKR